MSVLSISLDAQIAQSTGTSTRGDPVERQRRYAAGLGALHVVVKTGPDAPAAGVPLAPNAWVYATRSSSRYTFVVDAVRRGLDIGRRSGVDVVSAQDPFATGLAGWLVARRLRRPLNVQVHFDVLDNPYWVRERPEHRLLNALGKWVLRRADTIRVGTTRERQWHVAAGIPPHRIYVAPVPVDLAQFEHALPDPAWRHMMGGDSLALNASRLVPQKDLGTLLRAAQEVARQRRGFRLAIAGDGPLRAALERQRESLGLRQHVHFLGLVDQARMPGLTAAADLLVVSSLYEGTSLVTVQAAAAGKPVVTTNVAGSSDTVVDGQTGYVVPVGDHVALAGALLVVLADPVRAQSMGAAGWEHVRQRFNTDRSVEEVLRMWRETAAMSARR